MLLGHLLLKSALHWLKACYPATQSTAAVGPAPLRSGNDSTAAAILRSFGRQAKKMEQTASLGGLVISGQRGSCCVQEAYAQRVMLCFVITAVLFTRNIGCLCSVVGRPSWHALPPGKQLLASYILLVPRLGDKYSGQCVNNFWWFGWYQGLLLPSIAFGLITHVWGDTYY